jgi:hypothetical protein
MRRPHVNVATVLVDPTILRELELELAGLDMWVWPIATTPNCPDGPRMAFQIRRRMVGAGRGAWDCAAEWAAVVDLVRRQLVPRLRSAAMAAHKSLWDTLAGHADHTRYRLGLGGVPTEMVRHRRSSSRPYPGHVLIIDRATYDGSSRTPSRTTPRGVRHPWPGPEGSDRARSAWSRW